MNYWGALYKFAWVLAVLLLAIGVLCIFLPLENKRRGLTHQKEAMEEKAQQTEARINELRGNQERFQSDPSFVERTAREGGLVRTDETVFRFVPATQPPGSAAK